MDNEYETCSSTYFFDLFIRQYSNYSQNRQYTLFCFRYYINACQIVSEIVQIRLYQIISRIISNHTNTYQNVSRNDVSLYQILS